ncbi:MAG TPA: hypothetical protein VHU83_11505 [Bryobacteraceae bacterium]|jgi:hypothetical protein|nr:hypothetical protein [Bryobacteraceae bacterium]
MAFQLTNNLASIRDAISWLLEHGVSTSDTASLLKTNPNYIRQLVFRARRGTGKSLVPAVLSSYDDPAKTPSAGLRAWLGVRPVEDFVVLDSAEKKRLNGLLEATENEGAAFWQGVRFENGIPRYRRLLPLVGYPSHFRRIRLFARLKQLIAETYLHSGRITAALEEGMRSFALSSVAYHESESPHDLEQVGRTARLISQAFLLLADYSNTLRYLNIHARICERIGIAPRPEYFHQLATVHFLNGEDDLARTSFKRAMERLADTVDYGQAKQKHEVLDIGCRQLHLLDGNWEGAQELQHLMVQSLDPSDIHVSISANWTVATAFQTDSSTAQAEAMTLLEAYRPAAAGFVRQATTTELLALAPDLPANLRSAWVRYSLYQHALRRN